MGYFQRLFLIEAELHDLTDEDRHAERQLRSRPLLEEFKAWLDEQWEQGQRALWGSVVVWVTCALRRDWVEILHGVSFY
jgi:hypothetical protein